MTISRSKSKQRIIDAAFEHFVLNGYEGASLSAIADAVGIRKASIYTHFKSKDALFLELLQDALSIECLYLKDVFLSSSGRQLPGELYLHAVKSRYENAVTYQFLTRIAYVPPGHLLNEVTEAYQYYIEQITQAYDLELVKLVSDRHEQNIFKDAYLGILDSLSVELLYDGKRYERRLAAMLHLYKQSMLKFTND